MQLDLFIKPAEPKLAEGVDAVVDTQQEDGDVTDDENGDGSRPADSVNDVQAGARGPLQKGYRAVQPEAVCHVNEHLSAFTYQKRWPCMPWQEIGGSSVLHPHGKDDQGRPWMWLLDTKTLPKAKSPQEAGLLADGTLQCDSDGAYPRVPACLDCALALTVKKPTMPRYALANDNLIGREPVCHRVNGVKLSPVTFTMLSLARMVVKKVIAETISIPTLACILQPMTSWGMNGSLPCDRGCSTHPDFDLMHSRVSLISG